MKMRWYLINNSYLTFGMIPFNLYEVNRSLDVQVLQYLKPYGLSVKYKCWTLVSGLTYFVAIMAIEDCGFGIWDCGFGISELASMRSPGRVQIMCAV